MFQWTHNRAEAILACTTLDLHRIYRLSRQHHHLEVNSCLAYSALNHSGPP